MLKLKGKLFSLLGVIALQVAVWGEAPDPMAQLKERPVSHIDIRPAGMGGAFTAVADDENAFFYNPAGLAKAEERKFRGFHPLSLLPLPLFNLTASFTKDTHKTLELARDIKDAYDRHKGNMAAAVNAIYEVLKDYMPFETASSSWSFPLMVKRGWGIGLLTKADLRADIVERGNSPYLRSYALTDVALSVGRARELGSFKLLGYEGKVYGGLALKGLYRGVVLPRRHTDDQYLLGVIDIYQYMEDRKYLNTDWEDGFGHGLDLGLLIGFGRKERLTIGLAWQDAFTRIKFDEGWRKVSPRVRLGIAYSPPLTQKFGRQSMVLAAEIDDLTNEDRRSLQARLRGGVELHVGRRLWLRGGISHGYGTAGFGVKWGSIRIQWAWYAEETRPLGYGGKVRAGRFTDRRHVLTIRGFF